MNSQSSQSSQSTAAAGLLDSEERRVSVDLARDEAGGGPYPAGTFRTIVTAIFGLLLAISATYALPQLHWARPWTLDMKYVPFWNLIGRELLGEGAAVLAEQAEVTQALALARTEEAKDEVQEFQDVEVRAPVKVDETIPALLPHEDDALPVETPLEHPEALDRFYAALTRTHLGLPGAITRVMHYGDSAIGNDGIPGAIRSKIQARFGDAGHGFHLLGQPNASYRHQGVRFDERSPWAHCFIIFDCKNDRYYGLGGTTFESAGGAEVRLSTANKGPAGRKVARFEVWYAGLPKGGKLRLRLDDEEPVELDTAAELLEDRWHEIHTTDGEHTLSLRAAGGGKVRAYGVVMERDVPGVVWDEMSQIGALTRRMLNFDAAHIKRQLARRNADLIVLMFGGNDMNTQGTMEKYRGELASVIQMFRSADPQLPCLIMSPLDHGERDTAGKIVTRPIVSKLVLAQREVAAAEGCAFFDTFAAMGGSGSMGRWVRSSPALGAGDLAHLTHHGHKVIGALLVRALLRGYIDYRARIVGTPLTTLTASSAPRTTATAEEQKGQHEQASEAGP